MDYAVDSANHPTGEEMSESSEEMSELSEKMSELSEKMSDSSEKMSDSSEKMSDSSEKMSDWSWEDVMDDLQKLLEPFSDEDSGVKESTGLHDSASKSVVEEAHPREDPADQKKVAETETKKRFLLRERRLPPILDTVKLHVLPLLPAKSICRFRAVSKDWNRWLSGSLLAHQQSVFCRDMAGMFLKIPGYFPENEFISFCERSFGIPDPSLSFLPEEEVDIKASCNGLICCKGIMSYYICNPARKEWTMLPDPAYYHGTESEALLAFEPDIYNFRASYDLVCAIPLLDTDLIMFEMYSSRSRSWRVSETMCDELKGAELTGHGFYMEGSLFWEVSTTSEFETHWYILSLHVFDEQYGIIKLPEGAGPAGTLAKIRGELCYIVPRNAPWEIDIYGNLDMSLKSKVKLELGNLRNWAGDLDDPFVQFQALGCMEDGDVVLLHIQKLLVSYRISTGETRVVRSNVPMDIGTKCFMYLNSLVELRCLRSGEH